MLADFFFDLHGVREHKPSKSHGGIWDSDAILMPQDTYFGSSKSEVGESAGSPLSTHEHTPPSEKATPSGDSYREIKRPYHAPHMWSHAGRDPMNPMNHATRGAEEKAKLEWLTPEHLPGSPLCPLHMKYRGPSKGLCVYHGRASLADAGARRQSGYRSLTGTVYNEYRMREAPTSRRESDFIDRRKNSALDGSEDAEVSGEDDVELVGAAMTKRKDWLPWTSLPLTMWRWPRD